ncbi:breast cancer anti-estrogen resistance protein 1 isoform X1, partial [Lates japonicus]
MNYLNVLAKALYDNVAESPDELSFRKGDIMTVLERDTQGLDGWWLCSLHGRQGIVPGNRLKILVGMYDSKQQQQATPSTPDPAASCPPSQVQRPLPSQSAYAKPTPAPSSVAIATSSSGFANKPLPSAQYTSMHPAYSTPSPAQPNPDSVYMMPPSHNPKPSPQSLYQVPSGPGGPTPQAQPGPPSKAPALAQRQYQLPVQDIYQVPPSLGPGPGQGAGPTSGTGAGQDVYQVPPSLDKRNWESSNKPLGK